MSGSDEDLRRHARLRRRQRRAPLRRRRRRSQQRPGFEGDVLPKRRVQVSRRQLRPSQVSLRRQPGLHRRLRRVAESLQRQRDVWTQGASVRRQRQVRAGGLLVRRRRRL